MSACTQTEFLPTDSRTLFLTHRLARETARFGPFPQKRGPSRFRLGAFAHLGVTWLGLAQMGRRNALDLRYRKFKVYFNNLPSAFDGFRLLHLTDLHLDGLPEMAEKLADQVNRVAYDQCVITGDFCFGMPGTGFCAYSILAHFFSLLRPARQIFVTLGNHDSARDVPFLESLGLRVLLNESTPIEKDNQHVWVCGVDDPHGLDTHDLESAIAHIPQDDFKILLAHAPEIAQEATLAGIDFYLCGHTHGGQICLPWVGPLVKKSRCRRNQIAGIWQEGSMQGYTSSGVGASSVAARFFCPPEFTLVELNRQKRL